MSLELFGKGRVAQVAEVRRARSDGRRAGLRTRFGALTRAIGRGWKQPVCCARAFQPSLVQSGVRRSGVS
eukprot:10252400-Lingulodinium_polyedra.AAC.1